MRTYNVHVDFISEEGAVLYSRTYPDLLLAIGMTIGFWSLVIFA